MRPKLLIFAPGTATGGGSGFENLMRARQRAELQADIVGVVSHHEHGGTRERAERLGVPFLYFPGPYDATHFRKIVAQSDADFAALSGWWRKVVGLDPRTTFNIHPALLSQLCGRFGGKGMYGRHVHEAVKEAFDRGEIDHSGVSMHFVTDEYDRGPVFFEYPVPIRASMSAEEIGKAMNAAEHAWQPKITNMVIHEEIKWDGEHPESLVVPDGYVYLPHQE